MKVRVLTSMASARQAFTPGKVYEFPEDEAKRFIAAGFAEAVQVETKKASAKGRTTRKGAAREKR